MLQLKNQWKVQSFFCGYKIVGFNRGIDRISHHNGVIKVCVEQNLRTYYEMNNTPVFHVNVDDFFLWGIHIDVNYRNVGDLCEWWIIIRGRFIYVNFIVKNSSSPVLSTDRWTPLVSIINSLSDLQLRTFLAKTLFSRTLAEEQVSRIIQL